MVLHGAELNSVLDVIVDGVALERAAYLAASDTFQGYLPAGVSLGVKRGVIHTKVCTRQEL